MRRSPRRTARRRCRASTTFTTRTTASSRSRTALRITAKATPTTRCRLTSATGRGYTYDGNGNRLTMSPNGSIYTYAPGTNRIASVSDVFIAPDGAIVTGDDPAAPDYVSTFTHDGAGNITKWDFPATLTATYTYDPFNRLSAVIDTTTSPVTVGQYGYNAYGERTGKRNLAEGHNYAFIYDEGHRLIAERKDALWTNYLWFAGQLVGMTRGGALYQIHNDHLGRPELITNANKAIVWQSNNSPFGGMSTTTNTLGEFNIGFPGQYYDTESHYWYNVNRYYVAALGRYLQADPVGLVGGLNPYAYANNKPTNQVDPLGLYGLNFQAGFHLPFSPGIAVGPNLSATYFGVANGTQPYSFDGVKTDLAVGIIADAGVSFGVSDLSNTGGAAAADYQINIGVGTKFGIQITPRNCQDTSKPWWDPTRYIDGISGGLGAGIPIPYEPVSISGAIH